METGLPSQQAVTGNLQPAEALGTLRLAEQVAAAVKPTKPLILLLANMVLPQVAASTPALIQVLHQRAVTGKSQITRPRGNMAATLF